MRDLAVEVLAELRIEVSPEATATEVGPRREAPPEAETRHDVDWKAALLRGIWKGRP
jgi:hypothetical protein